MPGIGQRSLNRALVRAVQSVELQLFHFRAGFLPLANFNKTISSGVSFCVLATTSYNSRIIRCALKYQF
jgi:hypothetical protein